MAESPRERDLRKARERARKLRDQTQARTRDVVRGREQTSPLGPKPKKASWKGRKYSPTSKVPKSLRLPPADPFRDLPDYTQRSLFEELPGGNVRGTSGRFASLNPPQAEGSYAGQVLRSGGDTARARQLRFPARGKHSPNVFPLKRPSGPPPTSTAGAGGGAGRPPRPTAAPAGGGTPSPGYRGHLGVADSVARQTRTGPGVWRRALDFSKAQHAKSAIAIGRQAAGEAAKAGARAGGLGAGLRAAGMPALRASMWAGAGVVASGAVGSLFGEQDEWYEDTAQGVAAGAGFGATAGSLVMPGIGTIVGATLGAVAGGIAGYARNGNKTDPSDSLRRVEDFLAGYQGKMDGATVTALRAQAEDIFYAEDLSRGEKVTALKNLMSEEVATAVNDYGMQQVYSSLIDDAMGWFNPDELVATGEEHARLLEQEAQGLSGVDHDILMRMAASARRQSVAEAEGLKVQLATGLSAQFALEQAQQGQEGAGLPSSIAGTTGPLQQTVPAAFGG